MVDVLKQAYTVSQLTRDIKTILENTFPAVWVEGEVSNLRTPMSGHAYFSLKDEQSQLNCVMFKRAFMTLKFKLEDGLKIVCFGKVSVYDKSGQYQLYVEEIEPRGKGALQLALEQLKKKLFKEGLFDQAHKKPIPMLPSRIGVVTSPTGAAIRDILNVINRRFANVNVVLFPVKVQGEGAADEIARAIEAFNRLKNIDVMIVGRGGGSLEDLWAFNEEKVARAIFDSRIPIISAVGHEIDWTISDYVADLRAPTPSAAAELVIAKKEELKERLSNLSSRLASNIENLAQQYRQRIDELTRQLFFKARHQLYVNKERFGNCLGKLDALSPLAILSRGYSITLKLPGEKLIKNTKQIKKGDIIKTKLHKGSFISRVE